MKVIKSGIQNILVILCITKYKTTTQIKLLTLEHCSLYASYASSCTSSACRATEKPSPYPVPVPAGYAGGYPVTSASAEFKKGIWYIPNRNVLRRRINSQYQLSLTDIISGVTHYKVSVSPGAATDGVTPIFPLKKLTTFGGPFLVITLFLAVVFSPFDVVYPVFFQKLAPKQITN